ncbi:MAG: peptidylprolyl isomerase, partial [Coriobacteriales bacterium]|nr:peptidylprolyl isomerase [Coriobacteriales bacterium]
EPGFVIQGGDPKGNGTGGPGYTIKGEWTVNPNNQHKDGTLAMARAQDPDSAGSQFYFCLGAQPFLDSGYTVFGQAADQASLDVIHDLRRGDQIKSITIE